MARRVDIAIVGGGIAGSALACALGDSRYRVALVEGGTLSPPRPPVAVGVGDYDARVSALSPGSQALLSRLGVWEAMAALRLGAYHRMCVWDAEGTGAISFDAAQVRQPELGHIVENRVTVWALQERLGRHGNIGLLGGRRVAELRGQPDAEPREGEPAYHLVLDDGTELAPALVVAADGALSSLRQLAGFESREWDYEHVATVTAIRTERPHQHTAWQRFLPEGPLAVLPLGGADHYSSIVWSAVPGLAATLAEMDDEHFCQALTTALEGRLGAVLEAGPRVQFPLRQRHATQYFKPGIVLVGDAAHSLHPLAGQGINLGLKDVEVLAEELLRAEARGLAPGAQEILARYQRRRLGENLGMMAVMEGFKRLFAQRDLGVRWLRNSGMSQIDRMPWLKQRIMRQAMGL